MASSSDPPWLAAYPAHVDGTGAIPERPIFAYVDDAVARFPDRPCLDFLGKGFTYGEIGDLVNRAARGFQHLGVKKGVRVGLCLPNTPYYVICYFAVLKAGGTVVNFNPLGVESELARQVADSGTAIMVTLDLRQLYRKAAALLDSSDLKRIVVCPMGAILPAMKSVLFAVLKRGEKAVVPRDLVHVPFALLVKNDGNPKPVSVDAATDVAVLQYTGGTTGSPKGAMLTHANLSANMEQIRRWFPGLVEGEERFMAVLPFFHVFAMTVIMNLGMATGSELILQPRFELGKLLRAIEQKRPTLFPAVPTIFNAINSSPETAKYDLSSLRLCISGGMGLPGEVRRRFEDLAGCTLVEGYGLSEAAPVVTCNPIGGLVKDNSIGVPLPATTLEIRSLEDPRTVVPTGGKGEICVRGPQVMAGYWNRAEETAETLIDGFLRTGDVGIMNEDGYVYLIDRIKDVILCGGYNVYPRRIEDAIHGHPDVMEVTVIGIPDGYRGQSPKAFVRLRDGALLTAGELQEFLADKLSPIEKPGHIEFRDELPKTFVGKLSKKELVAEELARAALDGVHDAA